MTFRMMRAGFTLLEMLVVVAIIIILLIVIFLVGGRMIAAADSARCLSNLRQIGVGISLYVVDNDNRLPGPLSGGLHAFYQPLNAQGQSQYNAGRLATFLQDYISPPSEVNGGQLLKSDLFLCPAYVRQMRSFGFKIDGASKSYIRNGFPQGTGGTTQSGAPWETFGANVGMSNSLPPLRLNQVSSRLASGFSMSTIWIIKDLDGDVAGNVPDGPLGGTVFVQDKVAPPHPVHSSSPNVDHPLKLQDAIKAHPGAYRNALFFDFHVGRLSLDDKIL